MLSSRYQYAFSIVAITLATVTNWAIFRDPSTYWAPSILYLFVVTILGGFLGRGPIILAAAMSALFWDFLFIPPRFTLHVERLEDALILLTYAAIAAVTSLFTWRIRQTRALVDERSLEADRAHESEELYRIIFNSLSHELRSPLTAIMGASSALYLLGDGEVYRPEDRRELVHEIILSATRLSRLVDNFLDMSRLEAGHMQLKTEQIDLRDTVHEVLQRLRPDLAGHRIELMLSANPVEIIADPGMIFQAIFCVLHNASVYTPAGTKINISLRVEGNRKIQLEISDDGPGIGEISAERLFEKFFRGSAKQPGGAGIGLSLARRIVELHSGTLRAEKNIPRGLRFIFEISGPGSL